MKKPPQILKLGRQQISTRLDQEKKLGVEGPSSGWIRAIREHLGISGVQLARKLGMTKQALKIIESSEKKGTISVGTLRKIADALDCDVKVALIPRCSLDALLKDRAYQVAERIVGRTALHMALEDQSTSNDFRKNQIQELAEELIRTGDRRIWDDWS